MLLLRVGNLQGVAAFSALRGIRARVAPSASSLAANDRARAEVRSAESSLLQCRRGGHRSQTSASGVKQQRLREPWCLLRGRPDTPRVDGCSDHPCPQESQRAGCCVCGYGRRKSRLRISAGCRPLNSRRRSSRACGGAGCLREGVARRPGMAGGMGTDELVRNPPLPRHDPRRRLQRESGLLREDPEPAPRLRMAQARRCGRRRGRWSCGSITHGYEMLDARANVQKTSCNISATAAVKK